jgi:hypothetical protein
MEGGINSCFTAFSFPQFSSRKCVYWYSARSSLQDGFEVHVHIISIFICVRTGKQNTMVKSNEK